MSIQTSPISDAAPGLSHGPVERMGGAGRASPPVRRRSPIASVQDSIMGAFRRSPLKAAEAELVAITTRRDGLVARLADAEARAAEATAEQVRLLVQTDGNDAAALKKAGEACRRASDEVAALKDGVRVAGELVAEAQSKVTAEQDRIEREAAAAEAEARAERIRNAARELDEAARILSRARVEMIEVADVDGPRDPITGNSAAYRFVRAAGHASGLSPLADTERMFGAAESPGALASVICSAIHAEAVQLREGSLPPTPRPAPVRYAPPAVFPDVQTVLVRQAFFRNHLGQVIEVPAGGVTLPKPIAEYARAIGVGFGPQSEQGRQITRILAGNPNARVKPDGNGSFKGAVFTGALGPEGQGIEPAPAPADLGALPSAFGVMLPEAAQ